MARIHARQRKTKDLIGANNYAAGINVSLTTRITASALQTLVHDQ